MFLMCSLENVLKKGKSRHWAPGSPPLTHTEGLLAVVCIISRSLRVPHPGLFLRFADVLMKHKTLKGSHLLTRATGTSACAAALR